MRLKADVLLFCVTIAWGLAFVAQRVAGEQGSVYFFNGARYLLAALVVMPFIGRVGGPRGKVSSLQWWWMLAAGSILFVAAAFQQAGLLHTTAGNAGFLTSLYVVFVPFVLMVGWRERPHWLAATAVVLAAAGAFLLSTGGSFEVHRGDALELTGGVFWALHVVLAGKFAPRFDPVSFSAGQLAICGGLNLACSVFVEPIALGAMRPLLGPILFTAVFSLGIGYTVQIWAQRHAPPTDAALILSLESVSAAAAGWLILHEVLSPTQLFGCALILGAVLLSQARAWNSSRIGARLRSTAN